MKFIHINQLLRSAKIMILALALPMAVWSCQSNAGGDQETEETTEMEESSTEEHPSEGSEHPAPADTTAQDSTEEQSEHPSGGSEHPNN
mgnify:CR=1 FL=1